MKLHCKEYSISFDKLQELRILQIDFKLFFNFWHKEKS
jgi:hypothetical protein